MKGSLSRFAAFGGGRRSVTNTYETCTGCAGGGVGVGGGGTIVVTHDRARWCLQGVERRAVGGVTQERVWLDETEGPTQGRQKL